MFRLKFNIFVYWSPTGNCTSIAFIGKHVVVKIRVRKYIYVNPLTLKLPKWQTKISSEALSHDRGGHARI